MGADSADKKNGELNLIRVDPCPSAVKHVPAADLEITTYVEVQKGGWPGAWAAVEVHRRFTDRGIAHFREQASFCRARAPRTRCRARSADRAAAAGPTAERRQNAVMIV